ncbi:amino acid ABC transporter permease [Asaia platycodi]|uniref:amino acid ABC transporter permease n=1 Tax=Asaia platycodi TaxID=610243 RepID=UPI00046FE0E2|nr:amino acid ABC transporter permease [Asaia platycodi]
MSGLDFHPVMLKLPFLLGGVGTTMLLAGISFALGLLLAVVLVIMRVDGRGPVKRLSVIYGTALTNTPQLSQIFALFYSLPLFGMTVSPFISVLTGMALNAAAYLAEILVTGLRTVPHAYHDAALTLGMSRFQIWTRVLLPHAGRAMYPALSNHFQIMILGSSMASIFGVEDLTGRAYDIGTSSFRIVEVMSVTAGLYIILSFVLGGLLALFHHLVERRV